MSRLSILCFIFFSLTLPCLAALPPLDDAERRQESSDVFRGQVRAIYTRKKMVGQGSSNLEMIVEIEVASAEKGDFKAGQVVQVYCWVVNERPDGWVGDGGQRPMPHEGDSGLFYVKQAKTGKYRLLHPNGWDRD